MACQSVKGMERSLRRTLDGNATLLDSIGQPGRDKLRIIEKADSNLAMMIRHPMPRTNSEVA